MTKIILSAMMLLTLPALADNSYRCRGPGNLTAFLIVGQAQGKYTVTWMPSAGALTTKAQTNNGVLIAQDDRLVHFRGGIDFALFAFQDKVDHLLVSPPQNNGATILAETYLDNDDFAQDYQSFTCTH